MHDKMKGLLIMSEENVRANDQFDMYQGIFLAMYKNNMFREFFQSIINDAMAYSDVAQIAMKYHYEYGLDYQECIPYVSEIGKYAYDKLPDEAKRVIDKVYLDKVKHYIRDTTRTIIDTLMKPFERLNSNITEWSIEEAIARCGANTSVCEVLMHELQALRDKFDTPQYGLSDNSQVRREIISWLVYIGINPYMALPELLLKRRVYNALLRADLLTVGHLIEAYMTGVIYKVRNLGIRGIQHLSKTLMDIGIPEEYVPVECVYDDYPKFFNFDASSDISESDDIDDFEDDEESDLLDSIIEQAVLADAEHINYNPRSIRVRCVETGEVFSSLRSASQAKRTSVESIRNVLKGRYEQSCGYHWERVN